MAFGFTYLTGSETAGYTSINALIDSIDAKLSLRVPNKDESGTYAYDGMVPLYDHTQTSGFTQGFINTAQLVNSAVSTDKIAALAVTEAKIAAGAVTNAKIGTDAVTLGTQTTGTYVTSVAGTTNQITATTVGTEPSTVTLSLPSDATLPGTPLIQTAPTYPTSGSGNDNKIASVKYVNDALTIVSGGGSVALGGDLTNVASNAVIATGAVNSDKILNNTILIGDLATSLQEFLVPTGSINAYAGATAPSGWLLCDGTGYSTSTYASLYTAIGYTYGGSAGTFKVPNLKGRVPLGAGVMEGNATSGSGAVAGGTSNPTITRGDWKGTYTITIASTNLPTHTHVIDHDHASFNTSDSAGGHNHTGFTGYGATGISVSSALTDQGYIGTSTGGYIKGVNNVNGVNTGWSQGISSTVSDPTHRHTIGTDGAHNHAIDVPAFTGASGNGGFANTAIDSTPYVAVNYIIKV